MTSIERLVKALSYEGSVVLDFFAGQRRHHPRGYGTRAAQPFVRPQPRHTGLLRQAHEELAASGPLGPQHSLPPSESKRPGRPPGLRKGSCSTWTAASARPTPSSGRGCHAASSATMPSGSSCMHSPITSATSCVPWRCPMPWSNGPLTTLREKLVKIGAKVVSHGRYVTFQLAEVAVPRSLFQKILSLIDDLRRRPAPA